MARRRKTKEVHPFDGMTQASLRFSAKALCMRVAYVKRPDCALTQQEALNLIAPEEDHDLLRRCASIAQVEIYNNNKTHINFVTREGNVVLVLILRDDIAAPRNPVYQPDAAPTAHEKLVEYIDYLLEVCKEYEVVNRCVDIVYNRCKTLQEVRWLWPSIRLLAQAGVSMEVSGWGDLREFINNTEDKEAPKFSAALSKEEREMFRMASQYITAATCLEHIGNHLVLSNYLVRGDGERENEVGIKIANFPNYGDYLNPF